MTVLAGFARRVAAGRAVRYGERSEAMSNDPTRQQFAPLLGTENPSHDYRPLRDVIAEASQSGTGNSVLRIGQEAEGGGWTQTAYLVLSSAERERLIDVLMSHRRQAPGNGGVSEAFDAEEIEALVITAGEAVFVGGIDDDTLSSRQRELAQRAYDMASEF